jgi:hypothetical protein
MTTGTAAAATPSQASLGPTQDQTLAQLSQQLGRGAAADTVRRWLIAFSPLGMIGCELLASCVARGLMVCVLDRQQVGRSFELHQPVPPQVNQLTHTPRSTDTHAPLN